MTVSEYNISASLEDYLEAIYESIEKENHNVKAIEISKKLGVGRSSVTEALKLLTEKKLINYNRYDGVSLTNEGEIAAKNVILRHHTLFSFFNKILGLDIEESNQNACKIEHCISKKALDKLIDFIEFTKSSNCINRFKSIE